MEATVNLLCISTFILFVSQAVLYISNMSIKKLNTETLDSIKYKITRMSGAIDVHREDIAKINRKFEDQVIEKYKAALPVGSIVELYPEDDISIRPEDTAGYRPKVRIIGYSGDQIIVQQEAFGPIQYREFTDICRKIEGETSET